MSDAPVTTRRLDRVPLEDLRPHPRNPRRHKPAELRRSYERFGFTAPILLDERTQLIAAGHGRWELLTAMHEGGAPPPEGVEVGDEGEWLVPVIRGWQSSDDAEAEAYLIADNRQTELGGWDEPALAVMLSELKETDLGLGGTGFSPKDLESMLAPPLAAKDTVATENSYDQRAALYRNKQVRSIIFDYPMPDYEFVTTTAKAAAAEFGVETTAELFTALLRRFEEEHPA